MSTRSRARASIAAGFGAVGGGISGAGAEGTNVILSKVNAFAENSVLVSAGPIDLDAASRSGIVAVVAAASLAAGVGGTGVGVSIGAAVARNFIGWKPDGTPAPAEVRAYALDSSLSAAGDLSLTATASQTIGAVVLAGSAAVAAGGVGVAASGSGVSAENKIGVDVQASIDGDREGGISADRVTLTATDTATISSLAGAASLAASLAGSVGASISIGVVLARNTITSEVEASIKNVDNKLESTVGDIRLLADEGASIAAVSAAASFAAGFGGVAGIAVSGAGAEATNVILTKTNAYVQDSTLESAAAIQVDAANTSSIDAIIVAASAALSVGGTVGIGASIGAALATNLIGFTEVGHAPGRRGAGLHQGFQHSRCRVRWRSTPSAT